MKITGILKGITLAAAFMTITSFTAFAGGVEDLNIQAVLSEADELVARNARVRVYGIVDMGVTGLFRQSFGLYDGSAIIPVEGRNIELIPRGGEQLMVIGRMLKCDYDGRFTIDAEHVEFANVRRAGSRRIPVGLVDVLTAARAAGSDLSRMQDEIGDSIPTPAMETRYMQLLSELESYNEAIVKMVVNQIRSEKINRNMLQFNEFVSNLSDPEKEYFGQAINLITEKLINLYDVNSSGLVIDSIDMVRELGSFMWC